MRELTNFLAISAVCLTIMYVGYETFDAYKDVRASISVAFGAFLIRKLEQWKTLREE